MAVNRRRGSGRQLLGHVLHRRSCAGTAGAERRSVGADPWQTAAGAVVVSPRAARLYVTDAVTGERIGWRDERTGAVHVEDGADLARVHAGLKAWDAR